MHQASGNATQVLKTAWKLIGIKQCRRTVGTHATTLNHRQDQATRATIGSEDCEGEVSKVVYVCNNNIWILDGVGYVRNEKVGHH